MTFLTLHGDGGWQERSSLLLGSSSHFWEWVEPMTQLLKQSTSYFQESPGRTWYLMSNHSQNWSHQTQLRWFRYMPISQCFLDFVAHKACFLLTYFYPITHSGFKWVSLKILLISSCSRTTLKMSLSIPFLKLSFTILFRSICTFQTKL